MEKISDLLKIRREDLRNDGTPRVAICLCLDVSGSMSVVEFGDFKKTGNVVVKDGKKYIPVTGGVTRMDELQRGIEAFYEEIRNDAKAQYSAEICVVAFSDTAECISDFANIYRQETPHLKLGDMTAMGEGVNMALDLLEQRKKEYKSVGVDYYQPWLVLMTDGAPNGDPNELERAIARTTQLVSEKKLTIFPIGVGETANLETLARFTPKHHAIKLEKLRFKEFFEWLSESVEKTSQSIVGEKVELNTKAISQWGSKYSAETKELEPWPDELP